jgi:hypothetical protein
MMMLPSLILGHLMLLLIMELDLKVLFFSENSIPLKSFSLEKLPLLTLKLSLNQTIPLLLWDLTKKLLEKFSEKIMLPYSFLLETMKPLPLPMLLFKLLLPNYTEKSFYLLPKLPPILEKDLEIILESLKPMFLVLELSTPLKTELS